MKAIVSSSRPWILATFLVSLFVSGCLVSESDYNNAKFESTLQKNRVEALEKELFEERNNPTRMMETASLFLFRKEYFNASEKARELISKHPKSNLIEEANDMIVRAQTEDERSSKTSEKEKNRKEKEVRKAVDPAQAGKEVSLEKHKVPGKIDEDYKYIFESMGGITMWTNPQKSEVAGYIDKPGATVEVLEKRSDFWQVRYNGVTGWASVQLLTNCEY